MNWLLVAPIGIPFATAILCVFAGQKAGIQRIFTVISTAAMLGVSIALVAVVDQDGIQVVQIGNWEAPAGITVVADLFSAIMVIMTGLMGFVVAVYSLASMDPARERFGYYPLFNTLLMGVNGAFLTGDMFNLYVWFEVLLISSFVLLALGGERNQLAGAIQYVTLNLIASAIFLAAVGILYSVTGTLNMADVAVRLADVRQPSIPTVLAMMFLVAFGIKAAIFPLFFWLPASYHTPPVAVTAIFAALLTKVGIYALIRVFTLIFVLDVDFTHTLILIIAGFTMVTGVFGAAAEFEFRRILSFHIISQIGYMLMGLGILTQLALAGTIYFIVHNIVAKTNLFLISGVVYKLQGVYNLKKLGGLYAIYPLLGVLFLVPALALAGIPPLSGFWGKFILVKGGLEAEEYTIIAVSLFVSVWTLYSMMKIWAEAFLKDPPSVPEATDEPQMRNLWSTPYVLMMAPIVILAAITIGIGVAIEPVFDIMEAAAEQLITPQEYIEAVLGAES
ncbi:MAG: Na+/H+ antiporter subunit D [Chloroflexi bacterium]|nr:Na+/H+ antiporter subunit D [Chloroflexota bacterium]